MSFLSMRGQTLFVGNLVGEGTGIDFSDGTLQTTAYLGNTSEGIIPNQLTIKNSTNSTEVVISAGQNSSGTLVDDYVYYTATNPTEEGTSNTVHCFEGAQTTFSTNVYVANPVNLNSTLNVSGATTLEQTTINESFVVGGDTTLDSSLTVNGATFLLANTQIGSTASNSTVLYVDGKISQNMLNGNTALGYSALAALSSSTSGYSNTAVGYQSLISTTSGYANTSVGYDTLVYCDAGYANTAFGTAALGNVSQGFNNTSIGASSGTAISEGYNNTCLGAGSNILDGAIGSTVIGAGATTVNSYQICLGTSSNNTYIPGSLTVVGSAAIDTNLNVSALTTLSSAIVNESLTVAGQAIMETNLNVNALTTLTTAQVNSTLNVSGTSTFLSGFACGNQTTPYIMLIGTASVAYAGNALDALESESTNTNVSSVCTFNNSISFPTTIVGGYVNTNNQDIWASFISGVTDSTNQINVSFVNFGQYQGYFPSTISFICWGF